MKRAFLAGLMALALSACVNAAPGPDTFTGVWNWGFETSSFTTTRGAGPYWLVATGDTQQQLTAPLHPAGSPWGSPWGRVAIVVEGTLSPPGHYGQMGAYSRQLTVTRVIDAQLLAVSPQPSGS